jgi:hypothetical protein
MQLGNEERTVVAEIAREAMVDTNVLLEAIESEEPSEVARVLSIPEHEAARRLEPLRRAATVGEDWGAGCKILTDDVRSEIRAALRALLPADYSDSLGGSQG